MYVKELTKLYYSIGEVSEMFDVAPSLIRYWESEFKMLTPGKNSRGERKYTVKDIEKIKNLFHLLKERGFTIDGAKKELDHQKKSEKENTQLIETLSNIKKRILNLKDSLDI